MVNIIVFVVTKGERVLLETLRQSEAEVYAADHKAKITAQEYVPTDHTAVSK